MTDDAPELDVTHARQALRGRHAFMILVCSLALGLIALAAVYAFSTGSSAHLRAVREAPAQVAQTPAGQAARPAGAVGG